MLTCGFARCVGCVSAVIAMLLSTLFEGYRWTNTAIAGSLLALVGLVVALRAPRQPPILLQD